MLWIGWLIPWLVLLVGAAALLRRRAELAGDTRSVAERSRARARGSDRAELQHPAIDLAKCIGCGACVRACPEDGVLALCHGQAVVVHGARCVGHGRCADSCPTGAIALTLGDLTSRRDLPAVTTALEAVGRPGLFLAGEITGFALVRTAVEHGVQVAREVARRLACTAAPRRQPVLAAAGCGDNEVEPSDGTLDLLIVGAGPAGVACALAAKEQRLAFLCLEQQDRIGGTVGGYPRRKLVMTQPVELPLHGRLARTSYLKEELVELWAGLVRTHGLPVDFGHEVRGLSRTDDGVWSVTSGRGTFRARHVCLALGRRGTPRRLGVPGEDATKVCYSLLDAESFTGRRVLVVGGGDSAVEAALALAEQEGTEVTLSYRKSEFFRLKARNEERIIEAMAAGAVDVRFSSQVVRVGSHHVDLAEGDDGRTVRLANDDVFVLVGGTPPFPLLEAAGVSFDPALRPTAVPDRGDRSLCTALTTVVVAAAALLAFGLWHGDYYRLAPADRPTSAWHERLRPQGSVGLWAGLVACGLFLVNLSYLLRRSRLGAGLPGSLRAWMSVHVCTGLLALVLVCLHAGLQVRDSVGGHALWLLVVVVVTGAIGRWLYAFVPRAQNGRQRELEELGSQVAALSAEWDEHGRGFGGEVRARVEALACGPSWQKGFLVRLGTLVLGQWRLRAILRELRQQGRAACVPAPQVARIVDLARRAHRLALHLAHFDEVRALLSSWRWFHRWLALLMVLLTVLHVVTATRFGGVDLSVLWSSGGAP